MAVARYGFFIISLQQVLSSNAARLVALSLHQVQVTIENWEHAKALESQLKHRLDMPTATI